MCILLQDLTYLLLLYAQTSLPLYLLVQSNVHPFALLHLLQLGQHHIAVCNSSPRLGACFAQIAFVVCMGTTADVQCLQQLHKCLQLRVPLLLARPAVFQPSHFRHWLNIDNSCLCYPEHPLGPPLTPSWWAFDTP